MTPSGKGRSVLYGQGKNAKIRPARGRIYDRMINHVIHSSRSLENTELTKTRPAEVRKINASAGRSVFWKQGGKLWITCGK
jgi:hypothetical protein